jgi:nucleotide-binding universal stress UspA family protein
MKLLLATDGSEASAVAVDRLVDAVARFVEPPEITLLTVHVPVPMSFAARHIEQRALDSYYRDEGRVTLARAASRLRASNIAFEEQVLVGQPAEAIVSYAADGRFDWIWIGARGHGFVERVLLGSVAARVVQLAHCPVMVAR